MGHPILWWAEMDTLRYEVSRPISWKVETGSMGFVLSHPSDKNKDVARMGHPIFVNGRDGLVGVYVSTHDASRLGDTHHGWGTQILCFIEMGAASPC